MEETVCQTCGSKECANAFVYCVKCVKFAIHRYCLPVMPQTFTEFVRWYCEDCEETYGKPYPLKNPSSCPTLQPHGLRSELLKPDSQMVPAGPANVQEDCCLRAQPVIEPIWSGSFDIVTDGYGLCDGLVAHLSSKACEKVWQEAELFSKSLCMDMLPKTFVWPKSFQKSEPSEDSIALYFFASNKSSIKVFDDLVSEMMSKELALKSVVTNAELLIFTSNELPISYWKFEGKFYLWGVFRKKQASMPDSTNCQLMIQSVENGEYNSTNNKELDATSPISPLSNFSSSRLRWTVPDAGVLKLNVDTSFIPKTKQGAIGGLIRDEDGRWVHGFYKYIGNSHPEAAAFCAIFEGLQTAWSLGISKLTVESNSEEAVEDFASARLDHPLYDYIEVIRKLMARDWFCQITWVRREANTCAGRLTREAFNTRTTKKMAKPPEFMLDLLASDLQMRRRVV